MRLSGRKGISEGMRISERMKVSRVGWYNIKLQSSSIELYQIPKRKTLTWSCINFSTHQIKPHISHLNFSDWFNPLTSCPQIIKIHLWGHISKRPLWHDAAASTRTRTIALWSRSHNGFPASTTLTLTPVLWFACYLCFLVSFPGRTKIEGRDCPLEW